jgi:hypothetical protein
MKEHQKDTKLRKRKNKRAYVQNSGVNPSVRNWGILLPNFGSFNLEAGFSGYSLLYVSH